jgi:ABC-type dipeptide/oligopeptide/nickel transport system permease subunit
MSENNLSGVGKRLGTRGALLLGIPLAIVVVLVLCGLFAPWLAHTDPVMDANLLNAEEPPSWIWWFGTDAQGRDIYSRVVHGARISLTVGIVSQFVNRRYDHVGLLPRGRRRYVASALAQLRDKTIFGR